MNKIMHKILFISICIIVVSICFVSTSEAATFSISSSTSSVEPGETFQVTIRTNGAGYVNLTGSNCTLSSSYVWVEGSETITCTAGSSEGRATVSGSGIIADFTSGEDENKSGSTSVSIVKPTPPPASQPDPEPTPAPSSTPATTTKKETTKKEDTSKKEEEPEEVYINSITIKGIKENGEEIDIPLSSEFKGNDYEYLCTVPEDVIKIKVEKDAGEYTDNVIVEGTDELQEGENKITLQLSVEGQKVKIYTITATKEAKTENEETINKVESVETSANATEAENKDGIKEIPTITMPVWSFILLIIVVVVVEFAIIVFIPWKKIIKIKK